LLFEKGVLLFEKGVLLFEKGVLLFQTTDSNVSQSCFMPRHLRHMIYQLNYGIEYLGLGKVMCYQQKISTQIARVPRTYVVRG
jgi:hypothetical protein